MSLKWYSSSEELTVWSFVKGKTFTCVIVKAVISTQPRNHAQTLFYHRNWSTHNWVQYIFPVTDICSECTDVLKRMALFVWYWQEMRYAQALSNPFRTAPKDFSIVLTGPQQLGWPSYFLLGLHLFIVAHTRHMAVYRTAHRITQMACDGIATFLGNHAVHFYAHLFQ